MEYVIHLRRGTHECVGSGCKVAYYRITEQVGVKVYDEESDRDQCHRRQEKAHLHKLKLGPPTLGICDVVMHCKDGTMAWTKPGYLTGHADTSMDRAKKSDIVEKVSTPLRKILPVHDMHAGNVGEYEGRPVCIDFGFDGYGVCTDECTPESY